MPESEVKISEIKTAVKHYLKRVQNLHDPIKALNGINDAFLEYLLDIIHEIEENSPHQILAIELLNRHMCKCAFQLGGLIGACEAFYEAKRNKQG